MDRTRCLPRPTCDDVPGMASAYHSRGAAIDATRLSCPRTESHHADHAGPMTESPGPSSSGAPTLRSGLRAWLLDGTPSRETDGPFEPERTAHQHPWWQVMCLTGVDYFSTLGY